MERTENITPWTRTLNLLKRDYTFMAGLVVILLALAVSAAGYLITPDKTPWSNRQILELATRKPGFSCNFLMVKQNTVTEQHGFLHLVFSGQPSGYKLVPIQSYRFESEKINVILYAEPDDSIIIEKSFLLPDVVFAINSSAPVRLLAGDSISYTLISGQEQKTDIASLQEMIVAHHIVKKTFWLGTDTFGRDMLSRLLIGTRVSLSVGFIAVLIALLIGVTLGAAAGFYGGKTDKLIMWLVSVVWSVPTLLLVIAVTMVIGKGFWQIFIAVGLTMWVEVARIVRGEVMSLREKEFIEAARVLGYSNRRIIFRHILPNTVNPVIVTSASNFATAILIEAGLSFLGIGVQPPMPSWGSMIKDHYGYIILDKAFLALVPGIAIMLLVLAFMLVGNGLRDALDPKNNT